MGWNVKKALKKVSNVLMPGAWSAVETLGKVGQDVVDNISGKKAQERQNKANMDAWLMQQEYNTPANQMQRLLDAGLNPNLAYGNVSTGNASSAPEIGAASNVGGMLNHAFNALQLFSSLKGMEMQNAAKMAQAEYNRDVLDFQKNQAAISNAIRMDEMAYRRSSDEREYGKWLKNFDEQVRHHKALEGKPTTMGMLDSLVYGATHRHTTDILSEAGRAEKKYINTLFRLGPFAGIAKLHGKYF